MAQDSGSTVPETESSDPAAGSPSGVIYELPIGKGRQDAAPKKAGGGSSGSTFRSENDFGTSSKVPGYTGGGKRSNAKADDDDDDNGIGPLAGAAPPPDSGDTSGWRTFGLIALILVVGAGIAVLAWQGRRRYGS